MRRRSKLYSSRMLILFCYGCGYAIDLNRWSVGWDKCPLCSHELKLLWDDRQANTMYEAAGARFVNGKWQYKAYPRRE